MNKKYLPVIIIFLLLISFAVCSAGNKNNITEQHKASAIKLMQIFDSGNVDELNAIVAENIVEHQADPSKTKNTGLAGTKDMFGFFHKVFPDMKTTIHSLGVTGDTIFIYNSSTGTASEQFMNVMPGQKNTFNGVDLIRFEGDKIAEHWGFLDVADMINMMMPAKQDSLMMH